MPVPSIAAPTLTAVPRLRHGYFTRAGGTSAGIYASLNCGIGSADNADLVRANRASVAAELGVSPERLLTPYQIHGTAVATVAEPFPPDRRPRADALVTATPGLAIGIGTADCGPILFADPIAGVVGAAHAGWRGALDGILEATVAAMAKLGATPSRIVAVLGPTISARSYEVGTDFRDRFIAAGADNGRFFSTGDRPGHAFFDLPAFIGERLRRLQLGSVTDLGLCTYEDAVRFFSFRRATHRSEPDYGRLLSAIGLAD